MGEGVLRNGESRLLLEGEGGGFDRLPGRVELFDLISCMRECSISSSVAEKTCARLVVVVCRCGWREPCRLLEWPRDTALEWERILGTTCVSGRSDSAKSERERKLESF